jgi:PAAR motif
MPPAARALMDTTAHPLPPNLMPGPGSLNVIIGFGAAWRGMPLAAVAALQAAKQIADTAIKVADAAATAGAATPAGPGLKVAAEAAKAAALTAMSSAITGASAGADIHACTTPLPTPPHGPGVDISGSATVSINFLPAGRMGDSILEAIGPPNKITKGEPTVLIGG